MHLPEAQAARLSCSTAQANRFLVLQLLLFLFDLPATRRVCGAFETSEQRRRVLKSRIVRQPVILCSIGSCSRLSFEKYLITNRSQIPGIVPGKPSSLKYQLCQLLMQLCTCSYTRWSIHLRKELFSSHRPFYRCCIESNCAHVYQVTAYGQSESRQLLTCTILPILFVM